MQPKKLGTNNNGNLRSSTARVEDSGIIRNIRVRVFVADKKEG
jgi:hypothetical protein